MAKRSQASINQDQKFKNQTQSKINRSGGGYKASTNPTSTKLREAVSEKRSNLAKGVAKTSARARGKG